jgi:hypothetical protein
MSVHQSTQVKMYELYYLPKIATTPAYYFQQFKVLHSLHARREQLRQI